jgi:hypothetical protein
MEAMRGKCFQAGAKVVSTARLLPPKRNRIIKEDIYYEKRKSKLNITAEAAKEAGVLRNVMLVRKQLELFVTLTNIPSDVIQVRVHLALHERPWSYTYSTRWTHLPRK